MDLFEAIAGRYSYRDDSADVPVPREDLRNIVQAGIQAPTALNEQVAKFVIVDDPSLLGKIGGVLRRRGVDRQVGRLLGVSSSSRCRLIVIAVAIYLTATGATSARAEPRTLANDRMVATFDRQALVDIKDTGLGRNIALSGGTFALLIDEQVVTPDKLDAPAVTQNDTQVIYSYRAGDLKINVVYELRPAWRFVTKHLRVHASVKHRVKRVTVFDATLRSPVKNRLLLRGGGYGILLRFDHSCGMFACLQNPYNKIALDDNKRRLTLAYEPDMNWDPAWGPFESDRACLGTYALSGTTFPERMLPEWHYLPKPEEHGKGLPQIDVNEVLAMADCVRAFTEYKPKKSIRIHVDWCENAYQLDVSRPEHWEEYKRIVVRAGEVGCDHLLFSPHDSRLAPLSENRDAWGWESLLWLNLGQKIRKGEWVPGQDPVPAVVRERLAFAKQHGLRLVPYVYPSLPFMQDPQWTAWVGRLKGSPKPGGYRTVDTGLRSFQDWFVKQLVAFHRQTGNGGYAIDHWWIAYPEASTSKYAQWYGCRRILLQLRRRCPDIVVDGRQQYHHFGPWTWLGGSYPHPMASDEQPGSFRAFPDLHFSRVSANRTRSRNFWYRVQNFAPVEVVPGYMTHQTMRSDKDRKMRRDPYRRADWDYLGWKYSVISSIATAPFNHVVNYLPARKVEEFNAFRDEDKRWLSDWLDWTDKNINVLRKVRPIIGQPMVGRCDGTAAIDGDQGFVFLFNPNYRKLKAKFRLDQSIGLAAGKRFVFRQLYPDLGKGRLIGHPNSGAWQFGQQVTLPMRGASALVIELVPLPERIEHAMLLNSVGDIALANGTLELTGVSGEPGSDRSLAVLLPTEQKITKLLVNGKSHAFAQSGSVVTAPVRFAGEPFGKCHQIGRYDANFQDRTFKGAFRIPQRVFNQLEARRRAWPIPYNDDEIEATWNAPHRLLLFVNIADPKDEMEVSMKLDGQPVKVLKAYSSVYPQGVQRTFVGFYADASRFEPNRQYQVDLTLPALAPGQFQGLFVENIEPEYTKHIR